MFLAARFARTLPAASRLPAPVRSWRALTLHHPGSLHPVRILRALTPAASRLPAPVRSWRALTLHPPGSLQPVRILRALSLQAASSLHVCAAGAHSHCTLPAPFTLCAGCAHCSCNLPAVRTCALVARTLPSPKAMQRKGSRRVT